MGNVGAVFLFEWKRALTGPRILWWAVLAAFPIFIVGLIRYNAVLEPETETDRVEVHGRELTTRLPSNRFRRAVPQLKMRAKSDLWRALCAWLIFALVPMLVSMLGTLLWTTPAISTELERRSWIYLSVRPNGGAAVLLGKYLAAVSWVILPALVSLSIAVPLANTGDSFRIWWTMVRLVLLSTPAYAAIYLLIGVLMPRRAMVLAVAYTLIFELMISFVPAVINKITVQYRLRSLAAEWCDLSFTEGSPTAAMTLIGTEPVWQHIAVLICLTLVLVFGSIALLRSSEFSSAIESDS